MPKKQPPSQFKKLKLPANRNARIRLGLFVAAFAMIGAYLIFASFAAYFDANGEVTQYNDINNARAQNGRGGLAYNGCLSNAARSWAQQMSAMGRVADNPNYQSVLNSCFGSGWRAGGENHGGAWANTSSASTCNDTDQNCSQGVFDCFMQECGYNGTGHRDNILSTGYSTVGIGAYRDDRGTLWIVQSFAGCASTCPGNTSAPTSTYSPPSDPLPHGFVDQAVDPNDCHFRGWAVDDSDTNNQIPIHIYVNGQFVQNPNTSNHWWYANTYHNGVGNHGFDIPLPENFRNGAGYSYQIYAINIPDINQHTLLKSGTVVCDPMPVGHLDTTSSGHFKGWAFDRSQINNQIPIHVYINGNFVPNPNTSNHWWYANTYRPDVGGAFADLQNTPNGAYHGFDVNASGFCGRGTFSYQVYAINIYNTNAHTLIAQGQASC